MRVVTYFHFALLAFFALAAIEARADLSSGQARKLITRMAGFELPNNAIRIKRISAASDSSVEATAEILATFRLATNQRGLWRVSELRSGPDQWESLEPLSNSAVIEAAASDCDTPDLASQRLNTTDPSVKRARCLIAALLGVQLPSDSVRIKNVDPLALPLASNPSAVVEALVTVDVRFERSRQTGWVVSGLRTGNRDWVNLGTLVAAANEEKANRARADLQAMAVALEGFRAERRSYVVSESHAVLIDHLSPRYLPRVIRLDPWHKPYQYRGDSQSFTLRSVGPDGMESTLDDIVISGPA
jgi:hypothetical protein